MTKTAKNTLICILVLFLISVISVSLLAVANKFLQVEISLDLKTSKLINQIAPTEKTDSEAFDEGYIKMLDSRNTEIFSESIDKFNKNNKKSQCKVLALYVSTNAQSNINTVIIEVQSQGFAGNISTLTAFNSNCEIVGVVVKSQSESFWNTAKKNLDAFYDSMIGKTSVTNDSVAALTGATNTQKGIVRGVSFACKFITKINFNALGGQLTFE